MRKTNLKIGGIIVLFSSLLSSIFIAIFLWFSWSATNTIQEINSNIGGFYILPHQNTSNITNNKNSINEKNIITPNDLSSYYTSHIFERLPFIMVIFCTVLVLFTFILWRILLMLQNKSSIKFVKDLQSIIDSNMSHNTEPVFDAIYRKLNNRFEDHITDYKRLHSYLSHEQKNLISILRTELEISDNLEYMGIIDRISDSIDDILTLSESIEYAQAEEVDVSLICAEICDAYRNMSNKISFYFNEDESYTILAKERWIYRAISNLLDNAVKYGDDKEIQVSVNKKNGSVIVKVHDHGIGMEEAEQEKIFKHRYRINELKQDGYGIGLSVVSHVCDLCGGFLYIESEKNIGSTFYLTFPEPNSSAYI